MNHSLLRQLLKTYSYQFWGFWERLNGFTWIRRVYDSARVWPLRIHPRQAGYVSGMLAPVGIGITGALLIVGALYSIRMIHRKRRNSFKHQRRKVRQPEVNTTSYYFSFTFDGGSALYWVLSVPFIFFLSNLESPEPAVRTRPCCWLTAPRTSSDETLFWVVGDQWLTLPVKEARSNTPIAMTTASSITPGCLAMTHLIHRVWQSIGHNLHRLHKGQLCIPPPPSTSYQREHFSECCQVMLTVASSAGVVWCTLT